MKFPIPVRYEYRWLGPFDEYLKIESEVNTWKVVEPTWNQSVKDKSSELLLYRYKDKPTYEIRKLYSEDQLIELIEIIKHETKD